MTALQFVNEQAGRPGLLIAFCGIDGSGKSTQEEMLAQWMTSNGHNFVQTKQPTDFYRNNDLVRTYLDSGENALGMFGLALLAAADRQAHLNMFVRPAIARGTHVICNRYVYSSIAYFAARGVDESFVWTINRDVEAPDLTVLTDIDPALARERVIARDGIVLKFEERSLAFMETVRQVFLKNATSKFLVLDGREPAAQLHEQVVSAVSRLVSSRS
jgi:dTMP kinase